MERREVVAAAVVAVSAATAVAVLVRQWQRSSERRRRRARSFLRRLAAQCATPVPMLQDMAKEMAIHMGTSAAVVSNVKTLPTGDEEGVYYGLNLSETNFQMWRAQLGGKRDGVVKQECETVPIPKNLMSASIEGLFDCIAKELAKFVSTEKDSFSTISTGVKGEGEKRLGFTYSFHHADYRSESSWNAQIRWKTLSDDDAVGKDLVDKMNKALQRHAVPMKVSSIVHDSVGDLAGDRYYNGDVVAAIILGGGTNAAYVEHQHVEQREPKSREKIIGVELGSFSYSRLPITEFDADIQTESSNPSDQIFEKFVSATYLGEIVRRVLLKMAKETALFGDYIPPKLKIPYVLSSPDMAAMHQDSSDDRDVVGEKLKEIFEIADSTPIVREIVADACDIIVERGARIAAAAMVGILQKQGRFGSNKQTSVVTVDGGVYQHYRLFRNYLNSCVNEIQGSECSDNLHIQSTNGGSGIGAVFLAAAAAASQVENLLHN